MKAFRTGHYFLALFFTGFLTGILIVNYIWGEQLSLIGTFTEVYLMRLKNEKISFQQYIWYLIQVRGIFFLVLFLAMGIRIRKIVAAFSCAFALLLELSTESVEQTKNVLCMRFVFNWDFFRILS